MLCRTRRQDLARVEDRSGIAVVAAVGDPGSPVGFKIQNSRGQRPQLQRF